MPVGATVAVIGIVGGYMASSKADKLQKEAIQLQRDQLDFSKQRYADYQSLYGDLDKQLVQSAKDGVNADLSGVTSRAEADVAQQYANAEAAQERNNASLGITPDSGRAQAASRSLGLEKATTAAYDISSQREAERRNADQQTFARRQTVAAMGDNQLNSDASFISNANSGIVNSLGGEAAIYQNEANQLYGAGGTAIGMGLTRTPTPTPAVTTPAVPSYNMNSAGSTSLGIKPFEPPPVLPALTG
jgi:hypothetical protein